LDGEAPLAEDRGRTALIAVYLERRAELERFFALRLRSPAAAEDLVQEIFVRLASADAPKEIQNPAAYLYRLGSNLMLDRLRGERRAGRREAAWMDVQTSRVNGEEVSGEPSAETTVAARQRLDLVRKALGDLSPQTQRVFRMHKFEGMSHPQVAEVLGISRSAVEKHMMAALKHLAANMP
jgi:RNA polymerase sigma-70 factor (ECF subfamily)